MSRTMRDRGRLNHTGGIRRSFLSCLISVLIGALLFSLGCAGVSPAPQTPIDITDIKTVAGKWEGLLKRIPHARQDDWIEVAIEATGPETGIGEFASYRTAGVFGGKRPLKLTDGKLTAEGERGTATFTLYESGSGLELRLHADMKDGMKYDASLSRSTK